MLIRRARIERRMSQAELATNAGISQPLVSYYERGRTSPPEAALERLEKVLGLERLSLRRALVEPPPERLQSVTASEPPRSAFLRTIDTIGWRAGTFDRPAGQDGGDLAFAVDLGSHVFLVVLDAQGAGPRAAQLARLAAGCAFGATMSPGGGVAEPEDIVDKIARFWRLLDLSPQSVAVCVVRLERRGRRLRQCRLGMPPPFLRSGRVAHWIGKPDGPAGSLTGEHELEDTALLVIATDGVAHLPTKGERTLWDAPEFRTLISRATDPAQVIDALAERVTDPVLGVRADDRLAVVVMP